MKKPLIAIVGSIDEARQYDPPTVDARGAKTAAERLGAALAESDCRIVVYSADPRFIEFAVVRGFVQSGSAHPGSIVVWSPLGDATAPDFPERHEHDGLFDVRQDSSNDWEMSFYRSLLQVDGVVLIGGGGPTLITGVLALAYRMPILALAHYGGSATKVWASMVVGRDLPTEDEKNWMAREGSPDMAKKWTDSLLRQLSAKKSERRERSRALSIAAAGVLLCLWVATLPVGYLVSLTKSNVSYSVGDLRHTVFILLLFFAPLLSGASGATIRMLLPETGTITLRTTVLGLAAGAAASLFYVLGQLVGNPSPYNFSILAFSVLFGFTAGLTFDSVLKKLETVDPLSTDVLTHKKP